MDLIGIQVSHAMWGVGTIVAHEGVCLSVEFADVTKPFIYPEAIGKFISATDPSVQAAILADIQAAKEAKQAQEAQKVQTLTTATSSRVKSQKAKNIDEMFSADYHASYLARHPILTYQQVEEQFGINIAGFGRGINPTASTVVLISSIGTSSGKFVYHDKWTEDGDYLYSGEGRTGDQTMTKGNLAIKNAERDNKAIHLFVKFSPQEYYYQGVFTLVDYSYEDEQDETGNVRKEYKFRLRKAE